MSENIFKASNGYEVAEEGGELIVHDKYGVFYTNITDNLGDALREYFQHRRDQQLGRVRWPENPDYVIYRDPGNDNPTGRCIKVIREDTAAFTYFWEKHCSHPNSSRETAAEWYFTEGPGKQHPLDDARPGDLWEITAEGADGPRAVFFYETDDGYVSNTDSDGGWWSASISGIKTAKLIHRSQADD